MKMSQMIIQGVETKASPLLQLPHIRHDMLRHFVVISAHAQMPRLETVENCMKMSQMIIQGVETKASPLLQLPHIRHDMLRHFVVISAHAQMPRLETVENCMKMSQMIIQGVATKASPLLQLPHIRHDMLRHFIVVISAHAQMPRLETVENCMKMSQMIIQGVETKASPLLQLPHIRHDMLRHCIVVISAHAQMPRLETVENCMKMSQMIIQGVETKASPLLQLPHIRHDMLRHFIVVISAHAQMPRLETVENCMKMSQMIIQGVETKASPLLQLPHIRHDMLRHLIRVLLFQLMLRCPVLRRLRTV